MGPHPRLPPWRQPLLRARGKGVTPGRPPSCSITRPERPATGAGSPACQPAARDPNILLDFRDRLNISCLFITHNLATAYYLGGDMIVLCSGRMVESGDMDRIIARPAHPYTQQLLQSVPSTDPTRRWTDSVPRETAERPLTHEADKCVYVARCPQALLECAHKRPFDCQVEKDHHVACFLYHSGSWQEAA